MPSKSLLLTCEHGGNQVPADYRRLFTSKKAISALASHRGHDLGALSVARDLKRLLHVPLIESRTTRLLIDLNRSLGHPSLFSEFSSVLSQQEREEVIAEHYAPHRALVERAALQAAKNGKRLLHVAIHSFTPRLHGQTRNADFALLYDPKRSSEKRICAYWRRDLLDRECGFRIRLNYPYRGNADGLTTSLRKRFTDSQYVGVEIELNQGMLGAKGADLRALAHWIANSLAKTIAQSGI